MNVGNVNARLGHHHRVAEAPLGAVAPQPSDREQIRLSRREPGAGLGAFLALRLGEGADRDEAAPLLKRIAPHEPVELVGAGVVDRLGLQQLAGLALEDQGEAPDHRAQGAWPSRTASGSGGDHQAGVAGIDVPAAGIADLADRRAEQMGDLRRGLGHAIQVAHEVSLAVACAARPQASCALGKTWFRNSPSVVSTLFARGPSRKQANSTQTPRKPVVQSSAVPGCHVYLR